MKEKAKAPKFAGFFERYIQATLARHPMAGNDDWEDFSDERRGYVNIWLRGCVDCFDSIVGSVLGRLDDVVALCDMLKKELARDDGAFDELWRIFHEPKDWLDFLEKQLKAVEEGYMRGVAEAGIPRISVEDGKEFFKKPSWSRVSKGEE